MVASAWFPQGFSTGPRYCAPYANSGFCSTDRRPAPECYFRCFFLLNRSSRLPKKSAVMPWSQACNQSTRNIRRCTPGALNRGLTTWPLSKMHCNNPQCDRGRRRHAAPEPKSRTWHTMGSCVGGPRQKNEYVKW